MVAMHALRPGSTARVLGLAAAVLALCALAPVASRADDASTLTVVGTSDVFDSNLVQSVLKPGFQAAYPQYTLNYVSKGTGAAIQYAEAGTASALLVHAASLENQFVDQGYSAERYGRAIFWGDYVLLGPSGDPAGVMTDAPHDIVTAFERIAAAGAGGHANFVSRGGTPGTTVQEHAIWALTQGVTQCTVSDANGGGTSPSTASGACPGSISYPSWYHATGLTQGPNITNGDTCNYTGGGCYVFTDRGTYQYLVSTGAISNLHIVTRDNSASARGGNTLLVNSFHAYAVSPSKFAGQSGVQLNLPAATAFLDWVTSPTGQAAVGAFLNSGGDPPFIPDASPALTTSSLPASVNAGTPITVAGSIRNVVPGTPPLANQTVTLSALPTALAALNPLATPAPVATATTDGSASYRVSTGQLSQVENGSLSPIFADLLSPASASLGTSTVQSTIGLATVFVAYRQAVVTGTVVPGTGHGNATVSIGVRPGTTGPFVTRATAPLTVSQSTFAVPVALAPGRYQVQATYQDPNVTLASASNVGEVTVPGSSSATITKIRVRNGALALTGALSPAPAGAGARVDLLGRHTSRVRLAKRAGKAAAAPFRVLTKTSISVRRSTFTLRTRLRRGYHWQLELKYLHPGAVDTSYSRLRSVNVR
jgi:tungstate transport system substrate-binding protein